MQSAPSLKAADFQRALGNRPRARSPHFVLHYLPPEGEWARPSLGSPLALPTELSTGPGMSAPAPVDEIAASCPPGGRLGLVLPKRLARRAVTRTLMKGQARAICRQFAAELPAGDWVLRLRAPFDVKLFPSAASLALKQAVRQELLALFASACGACEKRS